MKSELADHREMSLSSETTIPPWLEGQELQESGVKAFRILVCGKTGVGKSTLINKVFGVEMVRRTLLQSETF
jgi:predicted GTPase